jgi:hypothetical protein
VLFEALNELHCKQAESCLERRHGQAEQTVIFQIDVIAVLFLVDIDNGRVGPPAFYI